LITSMLHADGHSHSGLLQGKTRLLQSTAGACCEHMHACLPATLHSQAWVLAAYEVSRATARGSVSCVGSLGVNAKLAAAAICILQMLSWAGR
jgi:hypothetical protein